MNPTKTFLLLVSLSICPILHAEQEVETSSSALLGGGVQVASFPKDKTFDAGPKTEFSVHTKKTFTNSLMRDETSTGSNDVEGSLGLLAGKNGLMPTGHLEVQYAAPSSTNFHFYAAWKPAELNPFELRGELPSVGTRYSTRNLDVSLSAMLAGYSYDESTHLTSNVSSLKANVAYEPVKNTRLYARGEVAALYGGKADTIDRWDESTQNIVMEKPGLDPTGVGSDLRAAVGFSSSLGQKSYVRFEGNAETRNYKAFETQLDGGHLSSDPKTFSRSGVGLAVTAGAAF